jgi:hypothetical protein
MWNYWAVSKWVYSVPLFETFKLFEMPLLGYFGFTFFSFETMLFVALIRESLLIRRHRLLTAAIALLVSLATFAAIDKYTVFSYTDTIGQLSFISKSKREELKREGVETSFAIDPKVLNQEEGEALALLHLKGLGLANVEKLRRQGIRSVPELARMTEEALSNVIGEKNRKRLRVYLRAARQYRTPPSY